MRDSEQRCRLQHANLRELFPMQIESGRFSSSKIAQTVNLNSHLARQSSFVRDMCKFDRSFSLCLTNALANGAKKGYVTLVLWRAGCTSCPSFQYNPLRSHVGRLLLDTVCTDEYLACAPDSRIYNGSTVTSYLQTVASPSPQKYSSVNYVGMFQLSEAVAWHKFAMIL